VIPEKSGGLFSDGTESGEDCLFSNKPTMTITPKTVSYYNVHICIPLHYTMYTKYLASQIFGDKEKKLQLVAF